MSGLAPKMTRGQLASLACLYEVTAPKPGNVHRSADFEDMTFFDFAASAVAIAPAMDAAANQPVGETILQAVTATQQVVGKNTNLGIILLLAPLATVPTGNDLQQGVKKVLANLTTDDCRNVYEAIGLAAPGGMGKAPDQDLDGPAPDDLVAAMRLAADRDHIAYQYAHNFKTVFDQVLPDLADGDANDNPDHLSSLSSIIVDAHVRQMARTPDTLIQRKCGSAIAQQSADRAAAVIASGPPDSNDYHSALADLDFWLRSDGHRRNPGTTADLIAAGLFVKLARPE